MLRKSIIYFLCLSILMCSMSIGFASIALAADGTTNTEQSVDKELETKLKFLETVGIIVSADDYRPDDNMTRAEFVAIISRMLGQGDMEKMNTKFADVTSEHWSSGNIHLQVGLRIIDGVSSTHFEPESPITYEQAIKLLICTLGYKQRAENGGGYPTGYLTQASTLKITKDIEKFTGNAEAKRGLLAKLVYNALFVDKMQEIGITEDGIQYQATKGQNVLTLNLGLLKYEGVVTSTPASAIIGSVMAENKVLIGTNTFDCTGVENINSYLGLNVNAYVKSDVVNFKPIVFIEELNNEVIKVEAKDIDASTTKLTSFGYWDLNKNTSKVQKYSISTNADFVCNGKSRLDIKVNDLIPSVGSVTLIDNTEDGVADVVIIEEIITVVVKSVDAANFKVYDKFEKDPYIFDSEVTKTITYTKGGKAAKFSDITKNAVLSIVMDDKVAPSYINVQIAPAAITGKVAEKYTDGNDQVLVVGETEIRIPANGYFNDNYPGVVINPGAEGSLYVDVFGNLVFTEISSSQGNYGYLIGLDSKKKGSTSVLVQLYNITSGAVEQYEVDSKFKLNNTNYDPSDLLTNDDLYKNGEAVKQLITFKVSGGVIKAINCAENYQDIYVNDRSANAFNNQTSINGYVKKHPELSRNTFALYESRRSIKYSRTTIFGGTAPAPENGKPETWAGGSSISSTTPVIVLPGDPVNSNEDFTDASKYQKKTGSYFVNGSVYSYWAYDMDENGYPAMIIVCSSDTGTTTSLQNKKFSIISTVGESLDKDDNVMTTIQSYKDGSMSTKVVRLGLSLDPLGESVAFGDAFFWEFDANGNIDRPELQFNASTAKVIEVSDASNVKASVLVYGLSADAAYITYMDSTGIEKKFPRTGKITVVDMKAETIAAGTVDDVADEVPVLIKLYNGQVQDTVVYKNLKLND